MFDLWEGKKLEDLSGGMSGFEKSLRKRPRSWLRGRIVKTDRSKLNFDPFLSDDPQPQVDSCSSA